MYQIPTSVCGFFVMHASSRSGVLGRAVRGLSVPAPTWLLRRSPRTCARVHEVAYSTIVVSQVAACLSPPVTISRSGMRRRGF